MSNNRRDTINRALKDLTKYPTQDRRLLINLIISKGWMTQSEIADYLGMTRQNVDIIRRKK